MIKNLDKLVKEKLLEIAKKLRIPNASGLTKSELISRIKKEESKKSKSSKPVSGRRQPARVESPLSIRVRLKSREKSDSVQGFVHPYSESAIHHVGVPAHEVRSEGDLPQTYGVTKIVLMVRDPYWCYAYWDFSAQTRSQIVRWFRQSDGAKAVLRVFDVTDRNFDGTNANHYFDIDINIDSGNWYLDVGEPNRNFLVAIGIRDGAGRFYPIAYSNIVRTPRDTPSEVIDEEWMTSEFELLYAVSGGFKVGLSSAELIQKVRSGKLFRQWLSSGALSSRSSS